MKKSQIIQKILLLIFGGLFIFSFTKVMMWFVDSKVANDEIQTISKSTKVSIIKDDEAKIIETDPDYYRLYKDVDLISVNFDELLKTNNETKGWLKVNNTNINYPFVQHKDNNYYLKHTYNKKSNGGGWVFLDYRNNANFEDFNTIIYGHGRKDKTIFGTLGKVLKKGYIDKKENQFVLLSTPTKNMTYQIFSAYTIPNTSDYIKTEFTSDKEKEKFIEMITSRNELDIDVNVSKDDKILTLSTCHNHEVKMVVHAKLVKYIERWYNTYDLKEDYYESL